VLNNVVPVATHVCTPLLHCCATARRNHRCIRHTAHRYNRHCKNKFRCQFACPLPATSEQSLTMPHLIQFRSYWRWS